MRRAIALLMSGLLVAAGPFDMDPEPTPASTTLPSAAEEPATQPDEPEAATKPAADPDDVATAPRTAAERTIAEVIAKDIRPSVCRIVVMGANGQPKSFGSGFIVSDDGFVITNAHVVEGATALQVEFPDDDAQITAELWQTWPQYDLSLVKIAGRECKPLTISTADPLQAEDVFTLGFPLSKDASLKVTRGIVSSMVDWKELASLINRKLTEYAQDIRFVQIDSAINSGNSGGPLINSKGEVIGVNTLSLKGGESVFYAVSAAHVTKLVAGKSSTASGFSVKAVATETTEAVKRPAKPKIKVAFPKELPPEALMQAATKNRPPAAASDAMRDLIQVRKSTCDRCSGKGEITSQVQVGRAGKKGVTYPVYETRTKPCDTCDQTGKITPKPAAVQQAASRAVAALAELDPTLEFSSPKMSDLARRWEAVVFENVINFGQMQMWSNDKLKLATKGATIFTVGTVLEKKSIDGKDCYLIHTGLTGTYLLSGQLHETRVTGDGMIIAGVLGETIQEDGRKYIVVHGGMLIDAPAVAKKGK